MKRRPFLVVELAFPRLLDISSGFPHGCVERLASPRQPDDAGAAISGIWMALDVSEALELSQHVVRGLFGEACCRGDLAWSPPIHTREPEERDHGRGDISVAGPADARQHFIPSELVRLTQPPDGAWHPLERRLRLI